MRSKTYMVDYWDTQVEVSIPEHIDVVVGEIENPPPLPNPEKAVREAIANPIASGPLSELAKKAGNGRVTIGFDDRAPRLRRLVMPIVIEELIKAGVKEENISLLLAGGNHCKWSWVEIRDGLGSEIFDRFSSAGTTSRLLPHDCHDPEGLIYMGESELGDYCEHNRLLADSDLFIYLGTVFALNWGGMTGSGVVIGLASARSMISTHGSRVVCHPDSQHGNHRTQLFRAHKQAIHKQIEKFTGKRIFYVDVVPGGERMDEIAAVFAGYSPEINEPTWELTEKLFQLEVPQVDIFIVGIARNAFYGETTNPLIALQAACSPIVNWINKPVLRDGGVIIALTACDGTIDERTHPAYPEVKQLWRRCFSSKELAMYEEEFLHREDLIFRYQHCHAFAPLHAFWLFYESQYALDTASKVIFAGVPGMGNPLPEVAVRGTGAPGVVRDIGCVPAKDFDHAWKLAEQIVGKNPKVLLCPRYWTRAKPQFVVK